MNKPSAKPTKASKVDRSAQILRDDKTSIFEVGLYDIDSAVKYYIDNVIQPQVKDSNGSTMQLPVIYGSTERWKSVQKSNFYRDAKGKIQLPLMMYKKTSIDKIRDLGNKIDPNAPLVQNVEMKYTQKNRYDNFSVLYGKQPVKEFHQVVVPDYVKVNYQCIVWTDMVSQMNSIIESINYAEGAYWGDPKRFNFKSKIDSFSPATEVQSGTDRATKCTFDIELQGYIIPNTIQKQINSQQTKTVSMAKVTIGSETVVSNLNTSE
tara:strand:+ start:2085 stop:2876 length:792 start_codon:yes stop_codon:yes gene_type:complete